MTAPEREPQTASTTRAAAIIAARVCERPAVASPYGLRSGSAAHGVTAHVGRPSRRGGKRFLSDEDGAVAVQFVFIIPLFVAFLAIVSDIGGAIWNVQAMQSAVGASARYLSRAPLDEDTANFTAAQIAQAQRLAVCGRVTATGGNGACQAQYAWWTDLSSVSVTLSAVDEDIDTVFDEGFRVVTVTANVQAQWRFLSIVGVDLTATTLSAEETTRYIGR